MMLRSVLPRPSHNFLLTTREIAAPRLVEIPDSSNYLAALCSPRAMSTQGRQIRSHRCAPEPQRDGMISPAGRLTTTASEPPQHLAADDGHAVAQALVRLEARQLLSGTHPPICGTGIAAHERLEAETPRSAHPTAPGRRPW